MRTLIFTLLSFQAYAQPLVPPVTPNPWQQPPGYTLGLPPNTLQQYPQVYEQPTYQELYYKEQLHQQQLQQFRHMYRDNILDKHHGR